MTRKQLAFTSTCIFILLSFVPFKNIQAQNILETKVQFILQAESSLSETLTQLSKTNSINIVFPQHIIPQKTIPPTNFTGLTLQVTLDFLLKDTRLTYKRISNQILLIPKPQNTNNYYTISGYVEDQSSGESLISANISSSKNSVFTNNYGFYSMDLPKGETTLFYQFIGYNIKLIAFELKTDTIINIQLSSDITLAPIIVRSDNDINNILNEKPFVGKLDLLTNGTGSNIIGDKDILQYAYNTVGTQTGTDGVGGLHVRGGSVDQNLVLLDGVQVFNSSHALGVFSIFNNDVLKKASFLKGSFPARYGGRLSSVLDIRTKQGNNKVIKFKLTTGLIAGKFLIEGPIKKNKSSYLFSIRRSLTDLYLPVFSKKVKAYNNEKGTSNYYFHDLNAKTNFILNTKNKLTLSFYKGGDNFSDVTIDTLTLKNVLDQNTIPPKIDDLHIKNQQNLLLKWGNTIGTIHLNSQLTNKFFLNTTIHYSKYLFNSDKLNVNTATQKTSRISKSIYFLDAFQSEIQTISANLNLDYQKTTQLFTKFGLALKQHKFNPGFLVSENKFVDADNKLDSLLQFNKFTNKKKTAHEFNAFIEYDYNFKKTRINFGLRTTTWLIDQSIQNLIEPRVLLVHKFRPHLFIGIDAGIMIQPYHLLTNSEFGLPGDIWVPATIKIKNESAYHLSSNIRYITEQSSFRADVYFKYLKNLINYKNIDFEEIINATNWEDKVVQGVGWNYGAEFSYQKSLKKLDISLNYTLSWSNRRYETINEGEKFPYIYDRRHQLKTNINYRFKKNWKGIISINYGSSTATSLPLIKYSIPTNDQEITLYQNSCKNCIRKSPFKRLNLSINHTFKRNKYNQNINFGIYNVLNQKNALYYKLKIDTNDNNKLKYFKVSILPILPFFNYSISL